MRYSKYSSATGSYSGQICVQHGLTGKASNWTREGVWADPVWAGGSLLLRSGSRDVIPGPLMIFYGPQKAHHVDHQTSGNQRPFSTVVAVNPQGTEALLDTERLGRGGGGSGATDSATLLRISDDRVLSTATLDRNEANPSHDIAALAPGGSWIGQQVITTDGPFLGGSSHPPATLITLTVTSTQVRLRSVKQFIQNRRLPMAQDLDQATQATPLHSDAQDVAVWFKAIGQIQYLQCDVTTDSCTRSPNYAAAVTPTAALVTNPSRP